MANPTTNFGWVMPASSNLVTNLPADFNTFGQAVDTSMQYLLGGTTGQVLSKTSGTNMAFTWITPTDQTPLTTKGDLFTFSTVDARLAVGTNGQYLAADSTQSTGLKWSTLAASGVTLISNTSFSAVSSVSINSCFTSTYTNYQVIVNLTSVSTGMDVNFRLRAGGTDTSANYNSLRLYGASGGGAAADLNNNGTTNFFKWFMDNTDVQNTFCTMELYSPQKALKTSINGMMSSRSGGGEYYITPYWSMQTGTTQFDGITMLASTGNFTGSIKVYGYGE